MSLGNMETSALILDEDDFVDSDFEFNIDVDHLCKDDDDIEDIILLDNKSSSYAEANVQTNPPIVNDSFSENNLNIVSQVSAAIDKRHACLTLTRLNLDRYRLDTAGRYSAFPVGVNSLANSKKISRKKDDIISDPVPPSSNDLSKVSLATQKSRRNCSNSKSDKNALHKLSSIPNKKVSDLPSCKLQVASTLLSIERDSSEVSNISSSRKKRAKSPSAIFLDKSIDSNLLDGNAPSQQEFVVLSDEEPTERCDLVIRDNKVRKKQQNRDSTEKCDKRPSDSIVNLKKKSMESKVEPKSELDTLSNCDGSIKKTIFKKSVDKDYVPKVDQIIVNYEESNKNWHKRCDEQLVKIKKRKKSRRDDSVKSIEVITKDYDNVIKELVEEPITKGDDKVIKELVEELILQVIVTLEGNCICNVVDNEVINCVQNLCAITSGTTSSINYDRSSETTAECSKEHNDKLLPINNRSENNNLENDLVTAIDHIEKDDKINLASAIGASCDSEILEIGKSAVVVSGELSVSKVNENLVSVTNVKSNSSISTKPTRGSLHKGDVKWLNPIANLTKSEKELRKIKRCSDMSREFRHNVKLIMKSIPKLRLIEIVKLENLKPLPIMKLKSKKEFWQPQMIKNKNSTASEMVKSRPAAYVRPQVSSLSSFDAAMMEEDKRRERELKEKRERRRIYKNNIIMMEKASNDLANRISTLPKIPKRESVSITEKKTGNFVIDKSKIVLKQDKNKFDDSKVRMSIKPIKELSKHRDFNISAPIKPIKPKSFESKLTSKGKSFNVDEWYKMELNDFWSFTEEVKPKPTPVSVDNNKLSNSTCMRLLPEAISTKNEGALIKKSEDRNHTEAERQSHRDPSYTYNEDQNSSVVVKTVITDRLSICAHLSDEELSIMAPSNDSIITVEDDTSTAKCNYLAVGMPSNTFYHSACAAIELRSTQNIFGFTRMEIWDSESDNENDESSWENAKVRIDHSDSDSSETTEREYFETKLKKMKYHELLNQFSILTIGENLPKCLAAFTCIMKYNKISGDDLLNYLQKMFFVARKNVRYLPHIISNFVRPVLVYANKREKLNKRMNLLSNLLEWLLKTEIESDGCLTKENCRISNYYLFRLLDKDFSFLLELYNKTIIEAINANLPELMYLYRFGSSLCLHLDVAVIRALITHFGRHNMWSWSQKLYNHGCGLSIYSRIKIRQWPINIVLKSFFSNEEIAIILYDLLSKFHSLLATKFFSDRGLDDNDKMTIFIRLECCNCDEGSTQIHILKQMENSSESLYGRVINVVKTMIFATVVTDMVADTKRSFVKLQRPLVEKLLRNMQEWVKKYNISPFPDYHRPGYRDVLSYALLTSNGVYCQYDENPFK